MERGYVKLWRKIGDSGLLAHPHALQVAIWCMIRCAWKPTKYATRNGIIDLEPGQVVVSRRKLAAELSMTERNVRTAIRLLSKTGFLGAKATHETTHGWTVITLDNWAKYQMDANQATHQPTTKRPTSDPEATQEEEVKTLLAFKELPNTSAAAKPPRVARSVPAGFEDFWKAYPKKVAKGAAIKAWAKAGQHLTEILAALEWQRKSEQWTKNGTQFVPNPATYLNEQRWLDENPNKKVYKDFLPGEDF